LLTDDSIYSFLKKAVADGGTVALGEVAAVARTDPEMLINSPAIAALICWGEPGLITIKEIALGETPHTKTAALKALAAVAAGEEISSFLLFIPDENLRALINQHVNNPSLRNIAKHQLAELVLSLPADDLLIPLGVAFQQVSLSGDNLARELISAVSAKWLRFGIPALRRYEEMLSTHATDERAFQKFFVQYPQFLDPMAIQVWSLPNFHGALEADFVIRRVDNTYSIVEIECPAKSIMTLGNQLTAEATRAEKQTMDYKNFLIERLAQAQVYFRHLRDPDCLAVIGLERNLSESQRKALAYANASRHNSRIVGFDWLGDRTRAIISNMSSGEIEVISRRRMR